MTDEPTIGDAFDDAISALDAAYQHVERLRLALRYRTLTTKDADKIRRLALTLSAADTMLAQLRDIAADRARREGTLA